MKCVSGEYLSSLEKSAINGIRVSLGIGGAVAVSIGVLMGVLAILRGLQAQTGPHLTGNLTWVPYLVTLVIAGVILFFSVRSITKPNRTDRARS